MMTKAEAKSFSGGFPVAKLKSIMEIVPVRMCATPRTTGLLPGRMVSLGTATLLLL